MTRAEAVALLRSMAVGLSSDAAPRLLERVAEHDEAGALRAALAELGAASLLVWRVERVIVDARDGRPV